MSSGPSGDLVFFFSLTVLIPALIAKFLVGASLIQVALAFPAYLIVLFLVLGHGTLSDEVFGFTLIFHMFTGWAGVPIMALILMKFDVPNRLF